MWNPNWPVLRHYAGAKLRKVAMPLGGIGTGTISLGGRGDLRDWEYMNRPAKGFHPAGYRGGGGFFALFAQEQGGPAVTRCLEGPLPPEDAEGHSGCLLANHGLPRFRRARFAAAYPLAQVALDDPEVPLAVRLEAFNPLVPPDADDSGLPVAVMRYVLTNPGRRAVTASVCGSLINHIGFDGANASFNGFGDVSDRHALKDNRNTLHRGGRLRAVVARSSRPDTFSEQYGTVALACPVTPGQELTHRLAWDATLGWGQSLLDFWSDFADDGRLDPAPRTPGFARAAADGQMGCLVRLYRDWRLCGDNDWLARLWPHARRAMAFCWVAGGWDADRDGVMEGCQHNTMDIEYYGPNPQMGFWYLAALRATAIMARAVDDTAFADTCDDLARRGRAWIEAHLFNGDYYEQRIRPVPRDEAVAAGLRVGMGSNDPNHFQLGRGCLVDQLVGQVLAHEAGLGRLADRKQLRATLQSIFRHNRRRPPETGVNPMRTYVLHDERGLVMASYPRGERPKHPFPYFNEFMTGFEYTAAVGLLQEGLTRAGLAVIGDVRRRYDGLRRNPFNEAECGHHYARALMSWAAVNAISGFSYDGRPRVEGPLPVRPGRGRLALPRLLAPSASGPAEGPRDIGPTQRREVLRLYRSTTRGRRRGARPGGGVGGVTIAAWMTRR